MEGVEDADAVDAGAKDDAGEVVAEEEEEDEEEEEIQLVEGWVGLLAAPSRQLPPPSTRCSMVSLACCFV